MSGNIYEFLKQKCKLESDGKITTGNGRLFDEYEGLNLNEKISNKNKEVNFKGQFSYMDELLLDHTKVGSWMEDIPKMRSDMIKLREEFFKNEHVKKYIDEIQEESGSNLQHNKDLIFKFYMFKFVGQFSRAGYGLPNIDKRKFAAISLLMLDIGRAIQEGKLTLDGIDQNIFTISSDNEIVNRDIKALIREVNHFIEFDLHTNNMNKKLEDILNPEKKTYLHIFGVEKVKEYVDNQIKAEYLKQLKNFNFEDAFNQEREKEPFFKRIMKSFSTKKSI